MKQKVQRYEQTAAQWTAENPILPRSWEGVESDTGNVKHGDGQTVWSDLAYATLGAAVLFDPDNANYINCGRFYDGNTAYDNDFWLMFKCKPEAGNSAGRYAFATSRTGNHVLMVGFTAGDQAGYLKLIAYHNANHVSVTSDIEFKAGEWHEFAIGLLGCSSAATGTFYAYIDGVPCGSKAKATSRHGNNNEQTLFIGGNEHSTLDGKIACVALFDGANQFPQLYGDSPYTPYPSYRSMYQGYYGQMAAAFLMDLQTKNAALADLSNGFNGGLHSGNFDNQADDGAFMRNTVYATRDVSKQPQWVFDPVALSGHDGTAFAALETNAIHQDSFTRANKTLESGRSMGLGALEYGGQSWSDGSNWGIIENHAWPNASGGGSRIATINTGQTAYSVALSAVKRADIVKSTATIVFRYQDANNYYRIVANGTDGHIYLVENVAGVEANVNISGSPVVPNNWSSMKLTLDAAGNITLAFDGAAPVYSYAALPRYAAATRAGMWSNSTLIKYTKFVVYGT